MTAIHYDTPIDADWRRERLYAGDLFVYSPTHSAISLCEHARIMIEEAFAPHDARRVHQLLAIERTVEILAELKPRFIHHPRSKILIQRLLVDLGCDQHLLLRRAAAAFGDAKQLSHFRHSLCVPSAPRHLVFCTILPTQLVAANLRTHKRQLYGLSSALLE